MNRLKYLLLPAAICCLFLLSCNHRKERPQSSSSQKKQQEKSRPAGESVPQTEITVLKGKAADQAHAMMDVDYHFSNLWFAGKAHNWPLARFYWGETRSHLRWAVRIIPVRKDKSGKEVKLKNILDSIENSQLKQLSKAIETKDEQAFETAYRQTIQGCYSCHIASDKPYLRPHIPQRPAGSIINFDPNAKWPM